MPSIAPSVEAGDIFDRALSDWRITTDWVSR